ncbi:putative aminoacyltransferase, Glutathione hydrolase [Arabidopsis thaliana]
MLLIRTATVALLLIAFLENAAALKRQQSIVKYHGAVATDDGRCSEIGLSVLREGGNAVDASVAAALCLGVVSPASSGIGGGAFMLVKIAGKEVAYDSRETAPLLASENMYDGNVKNKNKGPLSVGVPGEVAGLFMAWKQHGKLPWKHLVYPAEKLAAQGFRISKYLYMQMNKTRTRHCRNPKLALTLRQIAEYGPKAFYNGTVGVNLVRDIVKSGGIMTLKDLQSYRVKVRKPLSVDILGYRLLGMPSPSSGGAAMMLVLNILSQYGIPSGVSGSLGVHRLVEALKHTFAVRMNLGDPDFVDVSKVISDMLSTNFAQGLKKKINDNKTFDPNYYGGRWDQINDHGTSHLSIIDSERNAVSLTSTINSYFGALMLSPSTGIVLNNEMDDFSIPMKSSGNLTVPPPAPANFIRPGKRPLSSMTPTIVLKDGKVKASVGASGGLYIIAGTTEVFLNYFFLKMDPLSSVLAPRIYHQVFRFFFFLLPNRNFLVLYSYLKYASCNYFHFQLIPNIVLYENWTTVFSDHFEIPKETRVVLEKKGHVLTPFPGGTIVQFIVQESGASSGGMSDLVAVSDPRKGGFPSGY